MTQYMLSVIMPEGEMPTGEDLEQSMKDVDVLNEELKASGAWVFAGGLHPAETATVVRVKDGDTLLTDGPYAEGKEFLGGFTIVDVADLDAALEIAGRLAEITTLPIEVRPFRG